MGGTCGGNGKIGADLRHVLVYRTDQCVTPNVTPHRRVQTIKPFTMLSYDIPVVLAKSATAEPFHVYTLLRPV